jgi:hypothetical protein
MLVLVACQGGTESGLSEEEFWENYPDAACSWIDVCLPGQTDRASCLASQEDIWQDLAEAGDVVCFDRGVAAACISDLRAAVSGCSEEDYPPSCDNVYQSWVEVNSGGVEPRCELDEDDG